MVSKTANENEYGSGGFFYNINSSNATDDCNSMRKDGSSSNENSNNKKGLVIRKHIAAAVAAAFIFLATIIMVAHRDSNDHNTNNTRVGTSNTRGLGPAGIYDPDAHFCFKIQNEEKYCWYTSYSFPYGLWDLTDAISDCGLQCTHFAASKGGTFTCDDDDYGENDPRCNSECIDPYDSKMTMRKRRKPIWCNVWLVPFT